MKKLKQLSLVGLALTFILSSCSMEKRVYLSGYNIERLNGKDNPNKNELAKMDNSKKINENKIVIDDQAEQPTINSNTTDETVTASTDKSIFIPLTPKIDLHKKKTVVSENRPTSETKTIVKADSKKNNKQKFSGLKTLQDNPSKAGKYLTLWLVCIGGGIVLYLIGILALFSILLGIAFLLFLLAYFAWIAGLVFFILWIIEMTK